MKTLIGILGAIALSACASKTARTDTEVERFLLEREACPQVAPEKPKRPHCNRADLLFADIGNENIDKIQKLLEEGCPEGSGRVLTGEKDNSQ